MKKAALVIMIMCVLMSIQNTDIVALTDGEGIIFLKLKPGTPPNYFNQLYTQINADSLGYYESIGVFKVSVTDSVSEKTIILNEDSLVEFAQQSRHYLPASCELNFTPDDPHYEPDPNGVQKNLVRMSFPAAWECSHGEGVVIGFIDTGIKINHIASG